MLLQFPIESFVNNSQPTREELRSIYRRGRGASVCVHTVVFSVRAPLSPAHDAVEFTRRGSATKRAGAMRDARPMGACTIGTISSPYAGSFACAGAHE